MYYVLEDTGEAIIVGGVEEAHSTLANRFARGIKLQPNEQPDGLQVVIESPPEQYPDYFELQATPIASARFLSALQAAGVNNYDAYPVAIHEAERTVTGWHVINFLGRVSCMDTERTVCTRYKSRIARLKSLAIDETRIHGLPLFRLHEYELLVLVSQQVKTALSGLSGLRLPEAEGWSDQHRF